MFFSIAKVFWILCQPLTLLGFLMVIGLVFSKTSGGRKLLVSVCAVFLLLGFSPIGNNLLWYLEDMYELPTVLPKKIDGIIVLGGSIEGKLTYAHGQPQINDNAERLTEFVKLARLYPQAKLVFSGGDGSLFQSSGTESKIASIIFKDIGFSSSTLVFEDKSKNTYENMVFSKELVNPQPGETWVLVTSAFHLPRSVAIFSSNGWPVIPYPAGYITEGTYDYTPTVDVLGNYYKLQVAVREIVGIIAYTLTERIKPAYDEVKDDTSPSRHDGPSADTAGKS